MTLYGIEKLQTRDSDWAPPYAQIKSPGRAGGDTTLKHWLQNTADITCGRLWMCSSLQDGLPIFIWSMKRQTFAIEDTQTLPTTSPDSQKFDETKRWQHKKMRFRSPWSHLHWIYCTVSNSDIIPFVTTKYLFRLAWDRAFLGLYLLRHRINAFARS